MPFADLRHAPAASSAASWLLAIRAFTGGALPPPTEGLATSTASVCLPLHAVESESWYSGRPPATPPPAPPPLPPSPPQPLPPPASPVAPPYSPPISPYAYGYQRPAEPGFCRLLPSEVLCLLADTVRYCAVVRARNEHGWVSERRRSNGVTVCNRMPSAGWVTEFTTSPLEEATTEDADYTGVESISIHWHGFADPCGAPLTYTVTLERRASARWELEASKVLRTTLTNFSLASAGLYRAQVCAASAETGLTGTSSCATSDGIIFDTTPPSRGQLCATSLVGQTRTWCATAAPPTADARAEASSVYTASVSYLHWDAFVDLETPIRSFSWALGTAPGLADLQPWRGVQLVSRVEMPALPAAIGIAYLSVACFNRAGHQTVGTIKLVLDSTPPSLASGALAPVEWPEWAEAGDVLYSNSSEVMLRWQPSRVVDEESGIASVQILVTNGTSTLLEADVLDLPMLPFTAQPHVLYRASLRATNRAGQQAETLDARPFMWDPTPPSNGRIYVCDSLGQPLTSQANRSAVRLCADGFAAPLSGLVAHAVTLTWDANQQSRTVSQVAAAVPIAAAGHSVTVSGLTLPCAARLRITSSALSGAGLGAAPISHAPLSVECSPPAGGRVSFSASADDVSSAASAGSAFCARVGTPVYARWGDFVDNQTQIREYRYDVTQAVRADAWSASAVNITSFGALGAPSRSAGLARLVRLDTASLLVAPEAYRLQAMACNDAGQCSAAVVASTPLVLSAAPPVLSEVAFRTNASTGFLNAPDVIEVVWVAIDPTAVWQRLAYQACLGSTPFGCQILPLIDRCAALPRLSFLRWAHRVLF